MIILESAGTDTVIGENSLNCSNGFPERDRLVSDVDFPDGFTVVLIPEMNFTCNGTITGFTFAGRIPRGNENLIQIWRENSSQPGEYYRTDAYIEIDEAECVGGFTEVFNRVFRCDLMEDAQVSVQPGDILGLDLSSEDINSVSFATVLKGPTNYRYMIGEEQLLSSMSVILSNGNSENQELPQVMISVTGMLSLIWS